MIKKLMKAGIRARLIFSMILIIIAPILLTLGFLTISLSSLEDQAASQLNEIEKINRKLMDGIVAAYKDIDHPDKFYQMLAPLLDEYQLNLHITDNLGQPVFDSAGYSGKARPEAALTGNQHNYHLPIVVNGNVAGTATVIPDPDVPPYNIYTRMTTYVFLSIGAGFLSLIILLILFTHIITKSILHPLKELSRATDEIARGNLNYELKHQAADEIGQFAKTFDLMRIRLQQSLDKQAAYELSRKQLVANISHDLATPIAIIKGYVEGLEDGVARDEASFKRYLGVIKDKSEQLDRLVEDLTQYSKLELGRLEIKKELTDSKQIFERILSAFETSFENSAVKFNVMRPLTSVLVHVDKHRIEQVMDNLIKNAQGYSGDHAVIEVQIKSLDNHLQVQVKDNGIGISAGDLPYIFDLFYRGEKSRSREFGGSGQGLAISKFIIEAHGGEMWAESTPGKGSAFFFTLPHTAR